MERFSRREFLSALGGTGAMALAGCATTAVTAGGEPRLAVQLESLRGFIAGSVSPAAKTTRQGVGLARTFRALAAIGYRGVEFSDFYGNDARTIRGMLADAGLVACGTRCTRDALTAERLSATCDHAVSCGTNLLLCEFERGPEFLEFCNATARNAAAFGCRLCVYGVPGAEFCGAADPSVLFEPNLAAVKSPAALSMALDAFSGRVPNVLLGDPRKLDAEVVKQASSVSIDAWQVVSCGGSSDLTDTLGSYDYLISGRFNR